MPTSKTVKRVAGGGKTGPASYQRLSCDRVSYVPSKIQPSGGGSMQGWRMSRQVPKGGPSQSEYRRVKR